MNENIVCKIQEDENHETSEDLEEMLNAFEKMEHVVHNYEVTDALYASMDHYDKNFTVKELQQIYDYYVFCGMKSERGKKKKQDLICEILLFEENGENDEIVLKRKELWFYIEELKRDKFMKNYILGF
jgi:hypothetical protein